MFIWGFIFQNEDQPKTRWIFFYYTLIKKTIEFNRVSYRAVNLWVDSESIRFTIHKFSIQEWFLQIQNDSIHNKIWFD